MNVSPALLLAGGLLPLVGQFVSTCQQTSPAAVAATPSASPTPVPFVDLRGYTPDDLAAYAGYCDAQVRAALSRGDTDAARGWANTRNSVQAEMKRYPRRDRDRSGPGHHAAPSPRADQKPAATPTTEKPTRRPGYLLPPNWPTE
ncbi:MAG TPA: hypothetical protein VF207_05840 [Chthoniobacterales bacterium]